MTTWTELGDKGAEVLRCEMQAKHTAGLRAGWYVATGFFWHDACSVVAGPFTTQEDAMTCRQVLERIEGHHQYFIDAVAPVECENTTLRLYKADPQEKPKQ